MRMTAQHSPVEAAPEKVVPPGKVEVKCQCCKQPFLARIADRKRGWGKFCSKRCKAVKQERRTGQYADLIHRRSFRGTGVDHEAARQQHYDEDENGEICRPMSQEELSYGGYGDSDWNTPFHEGKF